MKWCKTLWKSYCSKITFSDVYENHLNPFWNKVLLLFSRSVVSDLFVTPWTAAYQASLSFTMSKSLFKLISMVSMMLSNHLIFCWPLLLLLPSIFPSIRVFSNESALCMRYLKYWSFSISPSNAYSGLISFRISKFDLLAIQETLKSPSAPWFKSISSLVLSVLYGTTLTFVLNSWKNHSFDYMDLSWQSDISAF